MSNFVKRRSPNFYSPLRQTEAIMNDSIVKLRYAENLSTSLAVRIRKPTRYRELTAARAQDDVRHNHKPPTLSVVTSPAKAPKEEPAPSPYRNSSAETVRNSYSRWIWLTYVPGG